MAEEDLIKVRLAKLENFRAAGQAPYADRFERTHTLAEAKKLKLGTKKISVAGRIMTMRTMGKLCFVTLQDASGKLQIAIEQEHIGKDEFKFFSKNFDIADFVGVTGELFETQKGEVTINVAEYKLLAKALRPLPEKWHGVKDQETKYRQRYLDMTMNEETRKRFELRANLVRKIREFYWSKGFTELETPVLENISSGAVAKPFMTHHNALDIDVYLRIAAGELWQKTAIVGGFEKTFEVARCFRNEGMDPSHLQEFSMVEHYAAYWNYEDNMQFMEEMFQYLLKETLGTTKVEVLDREGKKVTVDFKAPWPRKEYVKMIAKDCGIDVLKYDNAKDLLKEIRAKKIKIDDAEKMGYGNLVDHLYKTVSRPKLIQPTFVIKHPADTKPLARRNDEDPRLCNTFQLLVNTWEIINAYSELVDPTDQRARFEDQARAKAGGDEEAMAYNEEYLRTMEHGMPPMSGVGMGIDRLVTLLTQQENLRDVVMFPLMRPIGVGAHNYAPLQTASPSGTGNLSIPAPGISYQEALGLAKKYLTAQTSFLHSREAELVMRGLAKKLGQDEELWGIAGLLHDLDWDLVKGDDSQHCVKIKEIAKDTKLNPEFVDFLITHAYGAPCGDLGNKQRSQAAEHALAAAETITGLIFASALVQPDKKLANVKASSVKKKMKDKSFAAKVNREVIKEIEQVGITLDEFLEIALKAMQEISDELGL
ncbi:MAG: lysine--tRNA ligase [Candidatus Gracilibacteria bacterium]|nr:lysine--tRNA ligase [Candidatus Gracilibacteria bacterium]